MSHGTFDDDANALFASSNSHANARGNANARASSDEWRTLDETIWQTMKRDADRVYANARAVLFPIDFFRADAMRLREWDLWGPLVFVLALSYALSAGSADADAAFSVVFATVAIGAVALTANVVLLGGKIIFLQSVSLLGYCVAPLALASALGLAWSNAWYRASVTCAAVAWSSIASVPFVSAAVSRERRTLAVYPVMLMYVFLGWLAVAKGSSASGGANAAKSGASPPPPGNSTGL